MCLIRSVCLTACLLSPRAHPLSFFFPQHFRCHASVHLLCLKGIRCICHSNVQTQSSHPFRIMPARLRWIDHFPSSVRQHNVQEQCIPRRRMSRGNTDTISTMASLAHVAILRTLMCSPMQRTTLSGCILVIPGSALISSGVTLTDAMDAASRAAGLIRYLSDTWGAARVCIKYAHVTSSTMQALRALGYVPPGTPATGSASAQGREFVTRNGGSIRVVDTPGRVAPAEHFCKPAAFCRPPQHPWAGRVQHVCRTLTLLEQAYHSVRPILPLHRCRRADATLPTVAHRRIRTPQVARRVSTGTAAVAAMNDSAAARPCTTTATERRRRSVHLDRQLILAPSVLQHPQRSTVHPRKTTSAPVDFGRVPRGAAVSRRLTPLSLSANAESPDVSPCSTGLHTL